MLSELIAEMSTIELILQGTKIGLIAIGGVWIIKLLVKINNNMEDIMGMFKE